MRPDWMLVRQAEPSSAPVSAVTESALMVRAVMPAAHGPSSIKSQTFLKYGKSIHRCHAGPSADFAL